MITGLGTLTRRCIDRQGKLDEAQAAFEAALAHHRARCAGGAPDGALLGCLENLADVVRRARLPSLTIKCRA